uniref:Peptidase C1A papain C-terminal domain-containing protein n=2 Tax=Romanomermis culicivorax TaxID=13658 RepID=A0A915KT00_ROMCU
MNDKKTRFISANNLYACELDEEKRAKQRSEKKSGKRHHTSQPSEKGHNSTDPTINKFDDYQKKFKRQYKSKEYQGKKFGHFKENLDKIDKIKGKKFKVHHSGTLKPNPDAVRRINTSPSKPKCKKLQWTSKNIFPEAHDQLYCGSCYAISVADMILAQSRAESGKFGGHLEPLSSQYIVDCLGPPDAFQCNGGHPAQVLNYLSLCGRKKSSHCVPPKESCYKYTGQNGTCQHSCPPEQVQLITADMLDIHGQNEMDIMANLLKWGPVIAIVGISETWQFYIGRGVMRPHQCTTDQSHAVIVTGYDYTTCVPTYTVRNSWGTDWGAQGHIKLEAGKNTCGIAQSVIYSCSKKCGSNPVANFDYVMQNSNFPGC